MEKVFIFENGAQGDLELVDGELFFVIKDVPGQPGIHKYYASAWVHASCMNEEFWINPNWDDQPIVKIDEFEVGRAAHWIEGVVDLQRLGRFRMSFVCSDPRLPF